jgi:hypothetical protein
MMTVSFQLPAKRIALILWAIALLLSILSVALKAYEWSLGVNNTYWVYQINDLLSVDQEGNIPAWYNAMLWFIATILSTIIAQFQFQQENQWRKYWAGLSLLFLYLTLDEASAIHELFTVPLREILNTGAYLYFAWLLVGIPFALLMIAIFGLFVLALPRQTKALFILAGLIFLIGAVGIEAISANEWYLHDGPTLLYSTINAFEEFFEMTGLVILIYGLLSYIASHIQEVNLRFQE